MSGFSSGGCGEELLSLVVVWGGGGVLSNIAVKMLTHEMRVVT